MTRRESTHAVLDGVLRSARRQAPTEPDWARLEQDLLERLDQGATRTEPARRSPRWPLLAALALGAAAAVLIVQRLPGDHHTATAESGSGYSAPELKVAGASLSVGQRLVAQDETLEVTEEGLGVWQLSAHSSAEVRSLGNRSVVQLQEGEVRASIISSPEPERFQVHVGNTVVAVHGTEFSVAREGEQAVVTVTEGTVAVGRIGGAERSLLSAPATGRYWTLGESAGTPVATAPAKPSKAPTAARRRATPPTANGKTTIDALSLHAAEEGVAKVVSALRICSLQDGAPKNLAISLKTTLTLNVNRGGRLDEWSFVPPLAPRLDKCVRPTLKSLRFPETLHATVLSRQLELAL